MGSLLKRLLIKEPDESNDANIGNKEETNASKDLKDAPEGIDEEIKNLKKQEESKCVTNSSSSKLHQFENVVAIMDTLCVGLHSMGG